VANCARRNCERTLGAELVEVAPEVGEHVPDAGDRHGQKAPARVDALAEARDPRPAQHLVHPAGLDVGDEEAGRVRAEIDRADAHHLRGTTPRTAAKAARASPAAARSNASSARDLCSLVVAASRRLACALRDVAFRSAASAEALSLAVALETADRRTRIVFQSRHARVAAEPIEPRTARIRKA